MTIGPKSFGVLFIAGALASPALRAQSISAEESIETDGQLVSRVTTGTAPLEVTSDTKVSNLNADSLDGQDFLFFAFYHELLAAIDALDNPDPPCFNSNQRFVDCANGTVTDTATGLIFLKDANCFGEQSWVQANRSAATLSDGECGLSDGSRAGDWRLQSSAEWELILAPDCTWNAEDPRIAGNGDVPKESCYNPASPWASNLQSATYWTSTTSSENAYAAINARTNLGELSEQGKSVQNHVWPVRGGRYRITPPHRDPPFGPSQ